ncbi:MAG: hypothetical protein DYG88_01730 [Chloroflexi bacterium CFX4]|nr:hypothetical protein [Chloroflexi bacterium CFX4]MDL1921381.1 hypothetical protein [Chloroflexi bacterium CFX3]
MHLALDFLALLSSRGGGMLLSALVGLLWVRLLSAPAFGAYSLATTTLGLVGVLAEFGLDPILTRELSAQRGGNSLLRRAIGLRLGIGVALIVGMVSLAALTTTFGRADLLLIGGLGLLPRGAMRAYAAALIGLGKARQVGQLEGFTQVFISGLTVACTLISLAQGQEGATTLIAALGLGHGFGLLLLQRAWRRHGQSASLADISLHALLRAAFGFTLIAAFSAAFHAVDSYAVQALYGERALALYAAPFRLLNLIIIVPTVWGVVILPRYVALRRDQAAFRLRLRRDGLLWLLISIPLSVLPITFADVIAPVVLGAVYASSVPILIVQCGMVLPICAATPLLAALTVQDRQAYVAIAVIVGVLLLVIGNVLWAGSGVIAVAVLRVAITALLTVFYAFALR